MYATKAATQSRVPDVSSEFTCYESLDLTAWTGTSGTFLISGTGKVTPVSLTDPCLGIFPGAVGEFNATVTQVP